jgi:predicted nuclease of predicted toxin-antitoxin system
MILWIDAQLSPALARWLSDTFGVTAYAVRDLGLRGAKDLPIFHAAREAGAVLMSKDSDFVLLLERFGPPPQILWVTCGNTSNVRLQDILRKSFPEARARLEQGEPLVEISDAR